MPPRLPRPANGIPPSTRLWGLGHLCRGRAPVPKSWYSGERNAPFGVQTPSDLVFVEFLHDSTSCCLTLQHIIMYFANIGICVCIHVCMCIYRYTSTRASYNICVYVCVCIYIYTHICTSTYLSLSLSLSRPLCVHAEPSPRTRSHRWQGSFKESRNGSGIHGAATAPNLEANAGVGRL